MKQKINYGCKFRPIWTDAVRFKLPLAGEPEAAPPIVSLEKSCVTEDDEDELIIWLLGRVDEPNYQLHTTE